MKPAIIVYVPPPNWGCAAVFLQNLQQFRTSIPIMVLSEHDYSGLSGIEWFVQLLASPETARSDKMYSISNALFFAALKRAQKEGITHMLYLESDCRMNGDDWDSVVMDEYFNQPVPPVAAGTLVVHNPSHGGLDALRRYNDLVTRHNKRKHFPIAAWGNKSPHEPGGPCVFPNGAGTVYDVSWLSKFFSTEKGTVQRAALETAYDMAVGTYLWEMFGSQVYDVVAHLPSVVSLYGDRLTNEAQRMEMLRKGEARIVHQVKSNATV